MDAKKRQFQPPPHCPLVDGVPPPPRPRVVTRSFLKCWSRSCQWSPPAAGPHPSSLPVVDALLRGAVTAPPGSCSSDEWPPNWKDSDPALGPNRPAVVKWGLGALGDLHDARKNATIIKHYFLSSLQIFFGTSAHFLCRECGPKGLPLPPSSWCAALLPAWVTSELLLLPPWAPHSE